MLKPKDVFPRSLRAALLSRGQYVYAYYEPDAYEPFYVGKGSGTRALDHWSNAAKSGTPNKPHETRIQEILRKGRVPHVRLLAYNLDQTDEDRHSLAERVLQDAFAIQAVVLKTPEGERLKEMPARLLQKREDSAQRRPMSLESVVASHASRGQWSLDGLKAWVSEKRCPLLLVGLMWMLRRIIGPSALLVMNRQRAVGREFQGWANANQAVSLSSPLHAGGPRPCEHLLTNVVVVLARGRVVMVRAASAP